MNEERLIECIRKRECLYNPVHPKYINAKYKAIVWREIGKEMGLPIRQCKDKWQHIRNCHRKWRTKCANGLDTSNLRVHKYKDSLQFLEPWYNRANCESLPSNNRVEESNQPPPPPPPPRQKRSRRNLEEEALEIWENRLTVCTEAIEQQLQQYAETQREPSLRLFFESVIMNVSRMKRRYQTIVQQEVLQIISEFMDAEEKEKST